jgi:hypothetical protein
MILLLKALYSALIFKRVIFLDFWSMSCYFNCMFISKIKQTPLSRALTTILIDSWPPTELATREALGATILNLGSGHSFPSEFWLQLTNGRANSFWPTLFVSRSA